MSSTPQNWRSGTVKRRLPVASGTAVTAAASPRMSGEDRREQIIKVATKLFSRYGFNGITTKEIAAAAGVNQAILFRHFATKDDLYAAILEHKASATRADEWLAQLHELAARRDDEVLFRAFIAKILEHNRRDEDFLRLMLFSALEGHRRAQAFRHSQVRPIFEFMQEYIALRQAEGAFRPCRPGVAVRALIGMPSYHAQARALFDCRLLVMTDEEAVESFAKLVLDGLRLPSSRRRESRRRDGALSRKAKAKPMH